MKCNTIFKKVDGIISDRVFNYLHQLQNIFNSKYEFDIPLGKRVKLWTDIFNFYKQLSEHDFFGNNNPLTMTPTILYYIATRNDIIIRQRDIFELSGIGKNALTNNFKKLDMFAYKINSEFSLDYQGLPPNWETVIKNMYTKSIEFPGVVPDTHYRCWVGSGKFDCSNRRHYVTYSCMECNHKTNHLEDFYEHYISKHNLDNVELEQ